MINRRGFLGSLIATVGALTIDPEKLLWKPGEKTIFVPPLPPVPQWENLGYVEVFSIHDEIVFDLIDVTTLNSPHQFREYIPVQRVSKRYEEQMAREYFRNQADIFARSESRSLGPDWLKS